jgi:hypothetical protein
MAGRTAVYALAARAPDIIAAIITRNSNRLREVRELRERRGVVHETLKQATLEEERAIREQQQPPR